ncbi:E3 ubiquitin-protein ligase MARCH4 [Lingula anatina]|uniref:E3 ubiquitin-protein ligase MARCH4 n=1 Tax=Lingula anatina TaxID=7574 RepID=A0A1S3HUS6_LINAN|nr:E3 ubiquitin-protein ligase MARCH4-like [Lingula anatina]XP_013389798.1 E3 ubiquitin-protein ligase MARCH4-like [Lingula anatina]XP_013389799.1 E3 ubiquitin-protein ligase MARCH4-like [Lingula anatina]XP_013389800.1 E3 ubiquitin-protein ligase MARCH4-like [Lingula anatina]XP_013389801.1 E3 ubiquitin-protein ligase MARCH4-like [Lingula anatina]XP_013389802.1 E3 ubiquitin-protein ligase MARCH4-like [Lingula anatina]XP_013396873.1 E3 ubiquitin-protein ligase MARCH4 [Lingula anatina]XP_013396|eukprot:XP_013389797.1 E3 ubiquitin-protein ligase MARCH4-like [Lingula anatina]
MGDPPEEGPTPFLPLVGIHINPMEGQSFSSQSEESPKKHLLPLPDAPYSEASSANSLNPICRICHMPDTAQDALISPCRCSGTLQFIHVTCLKRWLEVCSRKTRKPPKCELCHYQFHRHKKFKCNHFRLPRVNGRDKILHSVFLINVIVMLSCAVITVMCFLSDKGQISKFPRNKVDLTTEEIVTLICGVLFFVSFFIAMSVQIKAKHTVYQLIVKFIMQNMQWEIEEYDKGKDCEDVQGHPVLV